MSNAVNSEVSAAAQSVAAAQTRLDAASAVLADATAKRTLVAERIDALEDKRDGITGRRQQGDHQPGDGPELVLIAADLEGLQTLLAEADAAVAAVVAPVEARRQQVINAEQLLKLAEDKAVSGLLVEHAATLDQLLLTTLERLRVLHKKVGGGTRPWGASKALMAELRWRAAERGEL